MSEQGQKADGVRRGPDGKTPAAFVADGVEYRCAVPSVSHFDAATEHLAALRISGMDVLQRDFQLAANNPDLQRLLVETHYKNARLPKESDRPTADQVREWLNTEAGQVYGSWLMMKEAHPEMTLDQASQIVKKAREGEVAAQQEKHNNNLKLPAAG